MSEPKEFWFVRHGQSEGNAGLPTASAGDIPLTAKGEQQAACVANYLSFAPDLFVVSPYIRTGQTAAPSIQKFPNVPVEAWPIEEFTYLPPEFHRNTTTAQRNKPAVDFFRQGDPDLVLGDGAESFNMLIARIDDTLERLANSSHKKVILFSHGWFIRTLVWRLVFYPGYGEEITLSDIREKLKHSKLAYKLFSMFGKNVGSNPMRHYLFFSGVISIPNGTILKFSYDPDSRHYHLEGLEQSHIREELIGHRLRDR